MFLMRIFKPVIDSLEILKQGTSASDTLTAILAAQRQEKDLVSIKKFTFVIDNISVKVLFYFYYFTCKV